MFGDCCPECGHLLPRSRSACTMCGWSGDFDTLTLQTLQMMQPHRRTDTQDDPLLDLDPDAFQYDFI